MLAYTHEAFGRQAAQDGGRLMLLYWGKHPQKPLDIEHQFFGRRLGFGVRDQEV